MFKKYSDSIKRAVALVKIRSVRKAFHHLSLMDNCQTFIVTCLSLTFLVKVQFFPIFVQGFLGLLQWPNSKLRGECLTS